MIGNPTLLSGLRYLNAVVDLLRETRLAHPTAGVWEAADLEWWWRKPRPTDELGQLFWFDNGRPVAAAIVTDWGRRLGLDIITLPDSQPDWIADVLASGLQHVDPVDTDQVEVMIDDADLLMASSLRAAGFAPLAGQGTSAWLAANRRPPIAALRAGYRLVSRDQWAGHAHHAIDRNGPDVEARLRQTSMYRPEHDLVVLDETDEVVANGLFWHDPITTVGFVEPMGTHEHHRRRGLARHILAVGLDRLVEAGATRLKINYENDNPASGTLYRAAGFEPVMTTTMYVRRPDA